MTMTATPWPWIVEAIKFKKHGIVALEMRMAHPEISRRVTDMIEAAPEKKQLLSVVADALEAAINQCIEHNNDYHCHTTAAQFDRWEAALKKARGEQ